MQLQNTEERMKMSIYDLNAYEVIREEDLSDLKSKGILLKHKKSQAKILLFANDDENKVFTIGFRTPGSGQYRSSSYYGTFRAVWLEKFSGERPVCGTGKGITEYVFKCYDLSGQDIISGCKL